MTECISYAEHKIAWFMEVVQPVAGLKESSAENIGFEKQDLVKCSVVAFCDEIASDADTDAEDRQGEFAAQRQSRRETLGE